MFTKKDDLLKKPNYLLTTYQGEIFRQLKEYMKIHNLSQKDVAEALGVSGSYVSQIMNGDFNFTLKKLIELSIYMGKVPCLEFVSTNEYWRRSRDGVKEYVVIGMPYMKTLESSCTPDISDDLYNINITYTDNTFSKILNN